MIRLLAEAKHLEGNSLQVDIEEFAKLVKQPNMVTLGPGFWFQGYFSCRKSRIQASSPFLGVAVPQFGEIHQSVENDGLLW